MATKVGGFTKSGVVQCMKLVEESSIEMFNGTVDSNVITLKNGMKITFTYGPSDTPAGYTQTGSYLSFEDSTYGTPFLRLDINNTSADKRVLASITNEEAWNSSEDLSIGMISGSIGAAVPSAPCKWVIEYKGQTDTYSISSQGPIITNAVGGNTLITSANRTPTVRMGKDGTLKCSKLIEEAVTPDASQWNAILNGATFTFDNGYRLEYRQGDSYTTATLKTTDPSYLSSMSMWIMPTGGYYLKIAREGTTNHFIASFQDSGSELGEKADTLWRSDSLLGMYPDMTFVTENASGGYDKSWFITTPHTYAFLYNADNTLVSVYEFTSGDMDTIYGTAVISNIIIPQKDRVIYPTVRVYKDGTIRCSEVEEATVTAKSIFTGTNLNFSSGFKITCYYNDTINPPSSLMAVYFISEPSEGGNRQPLATTSVNGSSGNAIQNTLGNGVNYLTNINMKISQLQFSYSDITGYPIKYVIFTDPRGNETRLDLNTSLSNTRMSYFDVGSNSNNAEILYTDRVVFTWPGSTPS